MRFEGSNGGTVRSLWWVDLANKAVTVQAADGSLSGTAGRVSEEVSIGRTRRWYDLSERNVI